MTIFKQYFYVDVKMDWFASGLAGKELLGSELYFYGILSYPCLVDLSYRLSNTEFIFIEYLI